MKLSKLATLARPFQAAWYPDTWQELDQCDVLLVRGDANCGYNYQGKAYAHLLDSMGDLCVMRGLVTRFIAKPYSKLTGIHAHNSPVSFNRAALIIGLGRRVVRLVRGRANADEWANKRRVHIWGRILQKANPHYVIGIQPDVGLCRASKINGVPVYDLQHGVIADEHRWYGKKYRFNTPPEDLPDGFLCWDETSAAILRKWTLQKGIGVRVIGNPWFARFLLKDPSDSLVKESSIARRIFNNNKPVVLVSLQWGLTFVYKYAGFNGVMADALEKAILETAGSYNWLLRLHPVQLRGPEKDMVQSYLTRTFGHLASVEWRVCSELALPVVLQQVDLHITEHSTIVVEAGWMGVYSALLSSQICPGGELENIYLHERKLGLATVLPQDTDIIKRWIAETLIKGKGKSTLKDAGQALPIFIDEIAAAVGKDRKHT
jgi:hypothetical protein